MLNLSEQLTKLSPEQLAHLEAQLPPLSLAQQRLWFLMQLEASDTSYNVPAVYRIKGALDARVLNKVFTEIIRRHEALRTIFISVNDKAYQAILPAQPINIPMEDLREVPEAERESRMEQAVIEEIRRPFNLSAGPLVRFKLLVLGAHEHVLVVTFHHIVTDGWSLGIFTHELKTLYTALSQGHSSPLPEPKLQYADVARWQSKHFTRAVLDRQLDFWKQQLGTGLQPLMLPMDHPRPERQSTRGRRQHFIWPAGLLASVDNLAREYGLTPFMVLLAGFNILLHRYSRQDDLVIGTGTANRSRTEFEGVMGFFVNTLALRTDLSGDPSTRTLLERVRQVALGAQSHQDVPFNQVVEAVRPARVPGQTPLVQVVFELQDAAQSSFQLPGLEVSSLDLSTDTSKFDLTCILMREQAGLSGTFEYSTDLFEESTIRRMQGHFRRLLESMIRAPEMPISRLDMLAPEEHALLTQGLHGTAVEADLEATLPQLFARQAERTPEALAVTGWQEGRERSWTFRQLDERAGRIAALLRERGARPGSFVGVCVQRSAESVAAVLGVLKSGAAYVPLDPSLPEERLGFMLEDSGIRLILADHAGRERITGPGREVLCITDEELASRPAPAPAPCRPEDVAYAIYTSGSTGKPKAVMVRHRSVLHLREGLRHAIFAYRGPGPLRATLNAPLAFDASVQQLQLLLDGHALFVVPDEVRRDGAALRAFLATHRIDVLDCTPSHLQLLVAAGQLEQPTSHPSIVLMGGEPVPAALWQTLSGVPGLAVYNVYGPTECTVDATCCQLSPELPRPILGRPLANVRLYVLEPSMQPAPLGVPGEIYIGGPGVAAGYLHRPELTNERFLPDPFAGPEARIYRTGDLARWLPDGTLEFLRRIDNQVKVRGYRIELEEIDAAFESLPGVQAAATAVVELAGGDRQLTAFVVSRVPHLDAEELQRGLAAKLPEYMVPVTFISVERLPLTSNGKIDRRALLRNLPQRPLLAESPPEQAPRSALEARLTTLWQSLLGRSPIGLDDNFFSLGGHSLLAAQMMSRLRKELGLKLSVAVLFESPTIKGLARYLERTMAQPGGDKPLSSLVALRKGGNRPPLFCIHALGGELLAYRPLLEALEAEQPLFGIQSRALVNPAQEHMDAGAMVDAYARELLQAHRTGPFRLFGWSLGGLLALSIAGRLEAHGRTVEFVEVWDCGLSERSSPLVEEMPLLLGLRVASGAALAASVVAMDAEERRAWLVQLSALPSRERYQRIIDWARQRGVTGNLSVETLEMQVTLAEQHVRLFHAFRPTPIQAEIRSVWARDSLDQGMTRTDWRRYTRGPISEQVVEGNHYSIMSPPHFNAAVDGLKRRLLPLGA
ncbi:non-ribosomal peptide synthetase [Archangium sp.]|uniref:non-ribosomal peptide synthetase n=1 Tax=Archangium sp. TaxID=1872627 RepID=UPI003899C27A